jgi:hypothetical protein
VYTDKNPQKAKEKERGRNEIRAQQKAKTIIKPYPVKTMKNNTM